MSAPVPDFTDWPRAHLIRDLILARKILLVYKDALEFYADPETYFAIGFFPDPPNGPFMDDFSATSLRQKPGKRARKALRDAEKIK
jgi:hypothetical protein